LKKFKIEYLAIIFIFLLSLLFLEDFFPEQQFNFIFEKINYNRLLQFDDYYDATDNSTVQTEVYSGSRKDLIALSYKIIAEGDFLSFLIGSRLELPRFGYPHNLLIEAVLSTGIIGGTLFLIMFIGCFIKSIKILINNNPWGWLGLLYIQYAVQSLASGSLYTSNVFWHLSFILICLPLNGEKKYFLLPPQNPVNIS
jgi:hypothetical protein